MFSVPTFVGMALIRKRIGQFDTRQQKIIAAVKCGILCFLIAVLGIGGAYVFRDLMVYDLPICGAILLLVGAISVALVTFTCLNIVIRLFTKTEFAG